jgi:hypothetical protein
MASTASKISTIARNFQTPSKSLGSFRPTIHWQRYADPHQIRFTQPTITQRFRDGSDINELIQGLRSGKVRVSDIPTIRVVEHEGQLMTLDNRRLAAFQNAHVTEIPINKVSLNDPKIFKEFRDKFNYINAGKTVVVIPKSSFRMSEEELLRTYGKIK